MLLGSAAPGARFVKDGCAWILLNGAALHLREGEVLCADLHSGFVRSFSASEFIPETVKLKSLTVSELIEEGAAPVFQKVTGLLEFYCVAEELQEGDIVVDAGEILEINVEDGIYTIVTPGETFYLEEGETLLIKQPS